MDITKHPTKSAELTIPLQFSNWHVCIFITGLFAYCYSTICLYVLVNMLETRLDGANGKNHVLSFNIHHI